VVSQQSTRQRGCPPPCLGGVGVWLIVIPRGLGVVPVSRVRPLPTHDPQSPTTHHNGGFTRYTLLHPLRRTSPAPTYSIRPCGLCLVSPCCGPSHGICAVSRYAHVPGTLDCLTAISVVSRGVLIGGGSLAYDFISRLFTLFLSADRASFTPILSFHSISVCKLGLTISTYHPNR